MVDVCAIPEYMPLWGNDEIVGDESDMRTTASVGIDVDDVACIRQVVVDDEVVGMTIVVGRKGRFVEPKVLV